MKFTEYLKESISDEQLDKILTVFTNEYDYDGASGNCGVFAVALNKFLGGGGSYVALVESDEPEFYSHVALKKNGKLYDFDGLTTKKKMKDEYANGRGNFVETNDDNNVIKFTQRKNTVEELLTGLNKSKYYIDNDVRRKK